MNLFPFSLPRSCPNHARTLVQNQSTFEKWLCVHPPGPMKPHSKGLFTRQQHQSPEPAHSWDPSAPSDPAGPFPSSRRWASHCIATGGSRLEAGAGLWNSKAQKGQQGLALLSLNLPPTTCLPVLPGAPCRGQEVGDRLGAMREGVGGRRRGEVHRLSVLREWESRTGRPLSAHLVMPSICALVSLDQVGVGWAGRHNTSEAGAHGLWQSCVPFSCAGSPEGGGRRVWQGEHLSGQWAQTRPYRLHSPTLLFTRCVFFLQLPFSTGGFTGGS